ncbi:MAG TPA: discoidin domain-containing protein [Vicinamibacterales bacterium]|nr:discoidin domain-containing protein [Vicinamibacterales bacterium]
MRNANVDNVRYGVFIEQSDSLNKVYGNYATTRGVPSIPGRSVGVYNNATSSSTRGITDKNTVFCNTSDVIADGLRVGSIATATGGVAETAHTFLFNNVVRNSRGNGILVDTQFPRSVENYFSQTVLSGNKTDINSHPSNGAAPPDFFNPPSAINLALRQPALASSAASDSAPEAAVDGLAYTHWIAGDEREPWLMVDLGSSVSFGRIMLKQIAAAVIARVVLQISQDGVTFTDLPGTAREIVMNRDVNNVSFAPVTARFVRVSITEFAGGPAGFEEVSVHPK